MYISILKVFIPAVFTFGIGILLALSLSKVMYTYRLWKRSGRGNKKENPEISTEFSKIHNDIKEISTPRVGGVVVWLSILVTTALLWSLSRILDIEIFNNLDFVSRGQTWLLFFGFIIASLIGLADDLLQIFGQGKHMVDGLGRWQRIFIVAFIGLIGALWFYTKLDISSLYIPFYGYLELGFGFIVFFIVVVLATFSGGIIDGLDGLAGGVLTTAFSAYGVIAYFQGQMDIAAFCGVIVGGILAFLWFNISPARFYMGETGMLGLTVVLALVAFFTNQVLVLIVIAFPLVVTTASAIAQKISLRFFHRKIFRVAPLHHHFQAIGWSAEKITMRYWVVSVMCAILGIIIALIG